MTKNERDKGEKILKSWANAKYRINQIQNELNLIKDVINKLDNFEKNIIIYRYQKNYSWDKIALVNHTSRSNCFNIKNRIIKEILLYH